MLQGCPKCDCSKGESMIERLLKENLIIYKSQYSFEDLKFKKNLRFDFAIFDSKKNLKFLIEFNGQQHYIFKSNFHKNEKSFSDQKNRDNLKIEYCKNNNIQLPVSRNGKSCTNEYGCDKLYNGDTVYIEGINEPYRITMYDNDTIKYLPFI
jgi:hypothetical protein